MSSQPLQDRSLGLFAPLIRPFQGGRGRFPALQAHSCLHSLKNSLPGHPQIAQRKQRDQLRRVLGQAPVAHLHEAELALDHPKRMPHLGPDAGLDLLQLLDQSVTAAAVVQRLALARSHRHVPVHSRRLGPLHGALVTRIGKHVRLLAVQQGVALRDVVDVGRCADDGVDQSRFVTSAVVVWPPGIGPLPPMPYSGMGRQPVMPRRTAKRQPVSVKTLAQSLPASAWQSISWREGTNERLSSRFAALRVRCAGGNVGKARLVPQQWLLIEWPAEQAEPEKYYLSTLPESTALNDLVRAAHMRWRIGRDYQDLKQDLGLDHYEGRDWRGFHHHASLSIAAYGFLVTQRLKAGSDAGGKKNFIERKVPAIPADYIPRGSPARAASRGRFDYHPALERRARKPAGPLPSLRMEQRKATLVTQ
jgi:hypothetical protein